MIEDTGDGGHCKDVKHVRVENVMGGAGFGKGWANATYIAHTSCVNVLDYAGWVVQLFTDAQSTKPRAGLRLLPELAEVMPTWLRRAARAGDASGQMVRIEHTFNAEWVTYTTLSPAGARWLAKAVMRAVEQAPAGVHG